MTLKDAFGNAVASSIVPLTFVFPEEKTQFQRYVERTDGAGLWALKGKQHRGNGVEIMTGSEALKRVTTHSGMKQVIVAQRIVENQFTPVGNHPNALRIWVLLAGGGGDVGIPRAYLFKGGTLRFGNEMPVVMDNKESMQSYIVSFSKEVPDMEPWSLTDLENHLHKTTGSARAFDAFMDSLQRSLASTLAASVPSLRSAASHIENYRGGNLDVFGIDVIISSDLEPWIIEINRGPSMKPRFANCTMYPSDSLDNDEPPPCEPNAYDSEKENFLLSFVRMMKESRMNLMQRIEAIELAAQSHGCEVQSKLLKELINDNFERLAAISNGFEDLTPMMYSSLACMTGDSKGCHASSPLSAIAPSNSMLDVVKDKIGSLLPSSWLSMPSDGKKDDFYTPTFADRLMWTLMENSRIELSTNDIMATVETLCGVTRDLSKEIQKTDTAKSTGPKGISEEL